MTDHLDRIIRDLSRMHGSAAVGALDEENACKLLFTEFTAPPRPTLSVATDAARPSIDRAIASKVGAVLDGKSSATGVQILGSIGRDLAEQVRERIDSNTPPELAPSTLATRRSLGRRSRTIGCMPYRSLDGSGGCCVGCSQPQPSGVIRQTMNPRMRSWDD